MKKVFLTIIFTLSFFVCLSIYVSTSYADTYVVSLPALPDDAPENYPYYVIRKIDDYRYKLYYFNSTDVAISNSYYYFVGKWWSYMFTVTEDSSNNVWSERWGWANGYSDNTKIMPVDGTLDDCNIVYSNFDIKYNDTLIRSKLELNTEPIEPAPEEITLSGIGEFFSNLGEKISNLGSTISNLFSNLINKLETLIGNIINAILSIPDLIISALQSILEFLFVPSENLFTYAQELFEEKFGIFYQVKDFLVDLTNINVTDDIPLFEVEYKGFKGSIIDFSMYSDYRSFIHTLIIAFSYFFFGKWLLNNVPTILGGIYSTTS